MGFLQIREKLPVFCFKCGKILHDHKGCTVKTYTRQNHTERTLSWGTWLRTEDYTRAPGLNDGRQVGQLSSPTPPPLTTHLATDDDPSEKKGSKKESSFPKGNKPRKRPLSPKISNASSIPRPNVKESKLRERKGDQHGNSLHGNLIAVIENWNGKRATVMEGEPVFKKDACQSNTCVFKAHDMAKTHVVVGKKGLAFRPKLGRPIAEAPSQAIVSDPSPQGLTKLSQDKEDGGAYEHPFY